MLWGRREILNAMPPFMGGGDMIREVKLRGSKWNELPWKFEAGTPAIAEAIGLGAAVDYLCRWAWKISTRPSTSWSRTRWSRCRISKG